MPGPLLLMAAPTLAKVGGALVVFIIVLITTLITAKSYNAPSIISALCVFASMAAAWKFYSYMSAPDQQTSQYSQYIKNIPTPTPSAPSSYNTSSSSGLAPPPSLPAGLSAW